MKRCDPNRTGEPFNRLYDVARLRGLRIGIGVGGELRPTPGGGYRDVVTLEVRTSRSNIVEPIIAGEIHTAATQLLMRLPQGRPPAR